MKRILVLSLSLICMLPLFAQQKLSVFGIAEKWDKSKEYSFDNAGRGPLFGEMVKSFAREYDANPMMHALLAQFTGDSENIDIPVSEFTLDGKNNYVRLRLEADELAETEARFWPLPGDKGWFVIKMINLDEDTLPRIYFLRVDTAKGVMKRAGGDELRHVRQFHHSPHRRIHRGVQRVSALRPYRARGRHFRLSEFRSRLHQLLCQ